MSDAPAPDTALLTVVSVAPELVIEASSAETDMALLVRLRAALAPLAPGAVVEIRSAAPAVRDDLAAWCRMTGNEITAAMDALEGAGFFIRKGSRAAGVERPDWAVRPSASSAGGMHLRDWLAGRRAIIPDEAPAYYGFIPRGAVPEPGMPAYPFALNSRDDVWTESLPDLYEQATAQQWSASSDIPWSELPPLPEDLERAVCQTMTFLAENEYAALYIPAKFLPRINAQYVEAILFLGTVINDEARHIEAFTKRAYANGGAVQIAAALTEWSLHSLLIQEDYFRSSFLLHVLGEGTFLELLEFIERYAPDPITAEIVRRARLDEGRHVAYGIAHVREVLRRKPEKERDLIAAAEERSSALLATSGANPILMHALAVLAGGGSAPGQMARGLEAVRALGLSMAEHRVRRLQQIGLDRDTAEQISTLHTPNFM